MKLAYPIMLGQVGHILTGIADSIMVGNISADHLAASSLGHSIYIIFFILGLGIATGITPLVGIAYGEKNFKECGNLFKNGLVSVNVVGFIIMLIMLATTPLLKYMGQTSRVIELAEPYYIIVAFSLLPSMLFLSAKQFIEGIGYTKPAMIASIVFNLLNIFLNYLLIYGNWGFPKLELEGAAWATLISRIGMGSYLAVYINYSSNFKIFLKKLDWKKYSFNHIKKIFKIGFPISIQFLLEVASFSLGAVMAGWVSSSALAAHQIAISIAGFTYLAASGIASAATIRVSNLKGERKFSEMKKSANASFLLVSIWMMICAVLIIVSRYYLTGFYVKESDVIELSAQLLIIAAFFQLFDGLQVTALGALRGIEDVKVPTIAALISYWAVSLPIAYILGIVNKLGAKGIWLGFLCGLIIAAGLLLSRFFYMVRKNYQQFDYN